MNRGIDHLVLCVRDLDRARKAYAAFGFTTTPRAAHPFGTGNSLVQLQGNFLELLAVLDESQFPVTAANGFSFSAFSRDFLSRREGMSMLVFEGHGAEDERAEFAAKGLDTYDVFHFERKATLPDGAQVTVGFSLTFVTHPAMPEAGFFTCTQHAPEFFWKPEYQDHPNGARAVTEVVLTAEDPETFAPFFAALQGDNAVSVSDGALHVATARGQISVLTPDRFGERFGIDPLSEDTPHFEAFRIAVADPMRAEALLRDNAVPYRRRGETLQIGRRTAFGCVLELAPGG